jgi:hypothetical protein
MLSDIPGSLIQQFFPTFLPMKLKFFFLILPFLILIYVFLIRDRLDSGTGIGGGGYDLTKLYTLAILGIYLLIFNFFLAIQSAHQNLLLLLIGLAQLLIIAILFTRTL